MGHLKTVKNLLIYKKALLQSDFANEIELLKVIKPLINQETLWKPHALILIGDYFVAKKEYTKAKEFFSDEILKVSIFEDKYK